MKTSLNGIEKGFKTHTSKATHRQRIVSQTTIVEIEQTQNCQIVSKVYCILRTQTHTHTHTHIHLYSHARTHSLLQTLTYAHSHTHTHIDTHTIG